MKTIELTEFKFVENYQAMKNNRTELLEKESMIQGILTYSDFYDNPKELRARDYKAIKFIYTLCIQSKRSIY